MTTEQFFNAQKIMARIERYQEQLEQLENWRRYAAGASDLRLDNGAVTAKIKLDREFLEPIIEDIAKRLKHNLDAMRQALQAL